jgi:hypothetical protein
MNISHISSTRKNRGAKPNQEVAVTCMAEENSPLYLRVRDLKFLQCHVVVVAGYLKNNNHRRVNETDNLLRVPKGDRYPRR